MISYQLYKVLHLLGAFLLVASLAGLSAAALGGAVEGRARRIASILHGLGLLLVLVAGFGLLARLDLGFEAWVWIKLAIWLALGAGLALARRATGWASTLFWLVPLLAALAGYLGVYKLGG